MTLGLTLCILTKQGHKQLAIITGTLQFANKGVDDHLSPSPHPLSLTIGILAESRKFGLGLMTNWDGDSLWVEQTRLMLATFG